jgi:hypothetical protein
VSADQNSPITIQRGEFVAEVLPGGNGDPSGFWYFMVRREGSQDILDIARYETRDAAVVGAGRALDKQLSWHPATKTASG